VSPAIADVWFGNVDALGSTLDALCARHDPLSREDWDRAGRIADEQRRQRWIRTHTAVRILLAGQVGVDCARLAFARSPAGKPSLPGASIDFSLSHSGRLALIGICPTGHIGVDVETRLSVYIDPRRRSLIEAAAVELAGGWPISADSEDRRFIQAWTRLEALAKARGEGIGALLTEIGIKGPAHLLDMRPTRRQGLHDEWCVLRIDDLEVGAGALAAVALPRECKTVLHALSEGLLQAAGPAATGLPGG